MADKVPDPPPVQDNPRIIEHSREHFGDDLAPILAAEEHRRGLAYIAGDHCADCLEVDRAWGVATCEHPASEVIDISQLGDFAIHQLCNRCGTEVWA